mmetsp:Transcript_12972/g.43629  ORF Transcript_12972/g.43629 Transcript_12972/m.43629 type:complete len:291 (+) Transcript_12972:247-1119(+)
MCGPRARAGSLGRGLGVGLPLGAELELDEGDGARVDVDVQECRVLFEGDTAFDVADALFEAVVDAREEPCDAEQDAAHEQARPEHDVVDELEDVADDVADQPADAAEKGGHHVSGRAQRLRNQADDAAEQLLDLHLDVGELYERVAGRPEDLDDKFVDVGQEVLGEAEHCLEQRLEAEQEALQPLNVGRLVVLCDKRLGAALDEIARRETERREEGPHGLQHDHGNVLGHVEERRDEELQVAALQLAARQQLGEEFEHLGDRPAKRLGDLREDLLDPLGDGLHEGDDGAC